MSAQDEEGETNLLLAAYAKYRAAFCEAGGPLASAPYDHIEVRDSNEFHVQTYHQMLRDHAQHLANDINAFAQFVEQLAAWSGVIPLYELDDQLTLTREFVEPLATVLITYPYALRSRFLYSVSHLSHQANLATSADAKESDLPANKDINFKVMRRVSAGWTGYAVFRQAWEELNDDVFEEQTDEYRHKYHHRFPSRIHIGFTEFVVRMPSEKGTSYGMGGRAPLELAQLIPALNRQHEIALRTFHAYSDLAREQLAKMYAKSAQGLRAEMPDCEKLRKNPA